MFWIFLVLLIILFILCRLIILSVFSVFSVVRIYSVFNVFSVFSVLSVVGVFFEMLIQIIPSTCYYSNCCSWSYKRSDPRHSDWLTKSKNTTSCYISNASLCCGCPTASNRTNWWEAIKRKANFSNSCRNSWGSSPNPSTFF